MAERLWVLQLQGNLSTLFKQLIVAYLFILLMSNSRRRNATSIHTRNDRGEGADGEYSARESEETACRISSEMYPGTTDLP